MSDLSLDQTPHGWDAVVETYEQAFEPLTTQYAEEAARLAGLKPGERVLDVAAGSGALTLAAAKVGAHVVATDFSPQMIERLRARITKEKFANVTAEVMDGQALEFPDNIFDAAFSVLGLMFFPDRGKGFSEMFRVLRPGGRAAVVAMGPHERFRFGNILMRAIDSAVPNFPRKPRPGTELGDPKRFESEMRNAKFKQVNIHTVTRVWTSPSPEWLWDHGKGMAPVITAIFKRLSPDEVAAAHKVFLEILHAEFGNGPVRLEADAHIGIGVK
ncbi:MAG: methyltransferase domain-containing protein [Candidatus Binatia bacterium]